MITIHACVASARARLRQAGIDPDEADLDARLLAQHVLGWDAARYFSAGGEPWPDAATARFDALIARRAARDPLAYVTGHRQFWGLDFEVSPAVLIPRPESELIVEAALERLAPGARATPWRVADVCTGSGCLAVAVAKERPEARVEAGDLSAEALAVASRNAQRHRVEQAIAFHRGDLLEALDGPFDLIVSNPPYVRDGDRAALAPEVRDHEPAIALFAGADGLDVIRRLIVQAPPKLAPGGTLIFELGLGQADAVAELISRTRGLTMSGIRRDLRGIPRTAIATKA